MASGIAVHCHCDEIVPASELKLWSEQPGMKNPQLHPPKQLDRYELVIAGKGSKRGNGYLRKMLIHGARAALPSLANAQTGLSPWLRGLLARAHKNTAVVALAAKLARIVWAVLRSGQVFELRRGSAL